MRLATFLISSLILLNGKDLAADSLAYTVTANANQVEYGFALSNSGATGGTLFDLFLMIPADISTIDTAKIGAPVGWGDLTGGLLFFGDSTRGSAFIEWSSDASGSYDVGIGESLSDFSFSTSSPVGGQILFALNGTNLFHQAQNNQVVAEPSVVWLFLVFLCAIGRCKRLSCRTLDTSRKNSDVSTRTESYYSRWPPARRSSRRIYNTIIVSNSTPSEPTTDKCWK